jgi:hypothetical protein
MIFLHGTLQFNSGYDYFNALILKIIFKNKKNHNFNTFPSEKYFEKQPQPHF